MDIFGVNKMDETWQDWTVQKDKMNRKRKKKSHQTMGSVNRPKNGIKELSNFTVFCSQFWFILNVTGNNNGLTIQFHQWIIMHQNEFVSFQIYELIFLLLNVFTSESMLHDIN